MGPRPRVDAAPLVFVGTGHAVHLPARSTAGQQDDAAGARRSARAARPRLDGGHDPPASGRASDARDSLPADFNAYLLDRFYSDLPIYAVIAGISFARLYAAQVKRGIREAHELALWTADLERRLVEARLQSLRAQLQPHFLFNALNTISAFTESNPQMARRLMAQLGDLLRASLRHTAQPLVTLGEELTFLDDFLAIESARFEGRLQVSVHADDDLLPRMVPGLPPSAARRERHSPRRRHTPVRRAGRRVRRRR